MVGECSSTPPSCFLRFFLTVLVSLITIRICFSLAMHRRYLATYRRLETDGNEKGKHKCYYQVGQQNGWHVLSLEQYGMDRCWVIVRKAPAALKPVAQPTTKPAAERAAQPAPQPTAKPTAKPAAQPTTKRAGQPAAKPAAQPAAHTAAQPPSEDMLCAPPRGGTYAIAESRLVAAGTLVVDTETSNQHVIQIGWVLADTAGVELCSYEQMWLLPRGVQVNAYVAQLSHKISDAELRTSGVAPQAELVLLAALFESCLAAGITIVMHNKAFDVGKLNATANYHGMGNILRSEQAFCSMLESRDICRLPWPSKGSRSTGAFKPPSNGELFKHFFGSAPQGRLHRALADARVTLASFAQAAKCRRWAKHARQRVA